MSTTQSGESQERYHEVFIVHSRTMRMRSDGVGPIAFFIEHNEENGVKKGTEFGLNSKLKLSRDRKEIVTEYKKQWPLIAAVGFNYARKDKIGRINERNMSRFSETCRSVKRQSFSVGEDAEGLRDWKTWISNAVYRLKQQNIVEFDENVQLPDSEKEYGQQYLITGSSASASTSHRR